MSDFGVNLRSELNFQDVRIKELSKKTKITIPTLDSYLRTKAAEPTVENAVKIAQALNVSVEYLVTGKEAEIKSSKPLSREALEVIRLAHTLTPKQCKAILNLVAEFRG